MHGSDVFSQVRAAGEVQLAVIPAAGVAQRLAPGLGRAATRHRAAPMAVEHSRGGAAAGRCALHVHQGGADTGTQKREGND